MNVFLFEFFVEKSLIQSFHEGIDCLIGIFQTADKILPLSNARLFDWRVVLDVCDGKISVENFIIAFLSKG